MNVAVALAVAAFASTFLAVTLSLVRALRAERVATDDADAKRSTMSVRSTASDWGQRVEASETALTLARDAEELASLRRLETEVERAPQLAVSHRSALDLRLVEMLVGSLAATRRMEYAAELAEARSSKRATHYLAMLIVSRLVWITTSAIAFAAIAVSAAAVVYIGRALF